MKLSSMQVKPISKSILGLFAGVLVSGDAIASVSHVVTTCADELRAIDCRQPADGTLRQAYFCAGDNDTIDLTNLSCSSITLAAPLVGGPEGEISIHGPGRQALSISGAGDFRIFTHTGSGDLNIYDLTVTNGFYDNPYTTGGGGCIFAKNRVFLINVDVRACRSTSELDARGGAIFASQQVFLSNSTISSGQAVSNHGHAYGGAIYSDRVVLVRSTISANSASTLTPTKVSQGGGIFTVGHAIRGTIIVDSTIANCSAMLGGAISGPTIYSHPLFAKQSNAVVQPLRVSLYQSTVVNNGASGTVGGIYAPNVQLYNSTVAFNTARRGYGAGVSVQSSITMSSSIVANNKFGNDNRGDVDGFPGIVVQGSHNLIMASRLSLPSDTLPSDPQLVNFGTNGGLTPTINLAANSPAIGKGAAPPPNPGSGPPSLFDQRGPGFPRVEGSKIDIGAVELNTEHIFTSGLDADNP